MKKLNNKGITLVTLVITIIVLLILSSIATYSGLNVIKSSKLTVFTTEMKIMQTKVNEIYQKYKDGNSIEIDGTTYYGENKKSENSNSTILDIGQALDSVSTQANKVFTESASGITNKDGYKYWNNELVKKLGIEGVDGDFFVNVEKRSIVSYDGFTYEGKDYYTLNQLPSNLYNVDYENKNDGKPTFDITSEKVSANKWKITISNIQYTGGYIDKWYVKYKKQEQENWQTREDMSFIISEKGKYTIKIENENISSEEKTLSIGLLKPGETADKTEKNNYSDGTDTATVPQGFTVSGLLGEQKIANGLVIYDIPENEISSVDWNTAATKYNQFVWIPVASADAYQRERSYPSYYDSNIDTTPANSTFTDTGYLPSNIQPTTDDATNNETAERTAVLKYNGFYIARYEAGNEKSKVVSKQNATVYTNETQGSFKTIGKTMYEDSSTYVKSAICSGIQWDMVMKFVDGKTDGNGNTYDVRTYNSTRHTDSKTEAGKNLADKVQNIYDLEGNCFEYVAEKNNTDTSYPFVVRGGYYRSFSLNRAGYRGSSNGNAYSNDTFRSALYIK